MDSIYLRAAECIDSLLGLIDVPDPNCSCHLNPPCNDCVDYSHMRAEIERAKEMIKQLQTYNLIDP